MHCKDGMGDRQYCFEYISCNGFSNGKCSVLVIEINVSQCFINLLLVKKVQRNNSPMSIIK